MPSLRAAKVAEKPTRLLDENVGAGAGDARTRVLRVFWRRRNRRRAFGIETTGLGRDTELAVTRAVLEHFAEQVWRFECDIPWTQVDGWPHEVREAAAILASHSQHKRSKDEGYAQTGILDLESGVWEAFVAFAPFAYDATVWLQSGGDIGISDEAVGGPVVIVSDEEIDDLFSALDSVFDNVRIRLLTRWGRGRPISLA